MAHELDQLRARYLAHAAASGTLDEARGVIARAEGDDPERCDDCGHAADDHDRRAEDGSCADCDELAQLGQYAPCQTDEPAPVGDHEPRPGTVERVADERGRTLGYAARCVRGGELIQARATFDRVPFGTLDGRRLTLETARPDRWTLPPAWDGADDRTALEALDRATRRAAARRYPFATRAN